MEQQMRGLFDRMRNGADMSGDIRKEIDNKIFRQNF
jgi:hypothetical protein